MNRLIIAVHCLIQNSPTERKLYALKVGKVE